jgi:aspartate carbamoyltransferase catalytic subunit
MMRIKSESQAILPELTLLAWQHHHILDLDDFTPEEIELIFPISDTMKEVLGREIKRVPTLRGKTIVNFFYEPSTRTRASFELAAKRLSADVVSITSPTSSVVKGESLVDTIRSLQALGADAIVIRHPQSGVPYLAAQCSEVSVINAGDGCHAHPTQALLDLYTIHQCLGRIKGIKVVIIGDIRHSRVARSNIWGLTLMGAQVVLCAPPTLLPLSWDSLRLPKVIIEPNISRALEGAEVVMALRLQKERQQDGLLPSLGEYIQLYQLSEERLAKARPDVIVMHPGPMNEGIEIAPEVAHGAHSVISNQVSNGVAIRMALFYLLLGAR